MFSRATFEVQVTSNAIKTTIGFLSSESIVLFISNIYLLFLEEYFKVEIELVLILSLIVTRKALFFLVSNYFIDNLIIFYYFLLSY